MSLPQVSGEKLLEDKSGASTRGNSSSDSVC